MKSSISIVIGALIIGTSIVIASFVTSSNEPFKEVYSNEVSNNQGSVLMTIEETARYLNISEEEILTIINSEKKKLESTGSFSGEMFPYFTLNKKIYISRDAIFNWLKDVSSQKREYFVNGDILN
ncbi:helix-turn-helix domain-containing protein [Paenibacillus thermotolerans]|uniref:helix-turn-helix domain-containing protein n=1 Tax=Paenibacillus thermotolerans TaxID=3027807 RepID=UPI0023674F85|nr:MULTISPECIES: helix-turn-helix domain-containing protein [unclassified Paenibacillus]